MIDQEISKIANDRIRIEIEEQNKSLRTEIDRYKRELAARGTLRSSTTITLVAGLCEDAIKNRAQLIWQTLFRFITTAGISYSAEVADELKSMVAHHLPEKLGDLREFIKEASKIARSSNLGDRFIDNLNICRKKALAKVGTEIDLFVHSLKKKAESIKGEASSAIFNIYSPVGSIQTGDKSIANITQNIDTEVKVQIQKALEEIISKLNESEVDTPLPKNELIEVAQESQVEIQKEKPNVTRLRSLLSTIGTSVQVVSSLKPAYNTLKQALAFMGISLP